MIFEIMIGICLLSVIFNAASISDKKRAAATDRVLRRDREVERSRNRDRRRQS